MLTRKPISIAKWGITQESTNNGKIKSELDMRTLYSYITKSIGDDIRSMRITDLKRFMAGFDDICHSSSFNNLSKADHGNISEIQMCFLWLKNGLEQLEDIWKTSLWKQKAYNKGVTFDTSHGKSNKSNALESNKTASKNKTKKRDQETEKEKHNNTKAQNRHTKIHRKTQIIDPESNKCQEVNSDTTEKKRNHKTEHNRNEKPKKGINKIKKTEKQNKKGFLKNNFSFGKQLELTIDPVLGESESNRVTHEKDSSEFCKNYNIITLLKINESDKLMQRRMWTIVYSPQKQLYYTFYGSPKNPRKSNVKKIRKNITEQDFIQTINEYVSQKVEDGYRFTDKCKRTQ